MCAEAPARVPEARRAYTVMVWPRGQYPKERPGSHSGPNTCHPVTLAGLGGGRFSTRFAGLFALDRFHHDGRLGDGRSEERRVGKERGARWETSGKKAK